MLQEELRTLNEQYAVTERQNLALRRQLHTARSNERRLQDQVSAMRKSFSWRITFPIRAFRRLFSLGRS
jgi:hypothetical protein